jgi:hypothetical protein
MKQKVKEITVSKTREEKVSDDKCPHFWDIEAANGPSSMGVCRFCGETREFLNAFPDFNPLRRRNSPLDLPKMPDVKVDEDSKS